MKVSPCELGIVAVGALFLLPFIIMLAGVCIEATQQAIKGFFLALGEIRNRISYPGLQRLSLATIAVLLIFVLGVSVNGIRRVKITMVPCHESRVAAVFSPVPMVCQISDATFGQRSN